MRVDRDLNLVLPLRTDDDGNGTLFAYSKPVSREVFEANYRIIAATYADIFRRGREFAALSGPRIAAMALREQGEKEADGGPNQALSLIEELKRLTTILAPGDKGWETVPVSVALTRGKITQEDWDDLEAGVVFFTCASLMAKTPDRPRMMETIASLLGASLTSSTPMEFAASLPTSTQAGNPKAAA